ncbi:MAG: nucleotidyltransferase family protein [Rhodospirillaceae bacterium]|nr:nucleotidyltransferase family protein [Rhodospirillaceae bacterium]
MVHIFLAGGRSLRLRLFPRPKAPSRKRKAPPTSLSLFDDPVEGEIFDTPAEKLAGKVAELCLLNRNNSEILQRMPQLGLRDWWLVSGCLFQTVWNLRSGRPAEKGIRDYDLCYFSEDATWEAEDVVIRDAAKLFADLPVNIQVRNQARVHLWFPEKFGVAYPPLTTAGEGVLRYPCAAQAIGLRRTGEEFLDVYAPYGLGDVWDLVARPNRALPLAPFYAEKTARWQKEWEKIIVYQWIDEDEKSRSKAP